MVEMNEALEYLYIGALLLLRLGTPIVVVVAIAHVLRGLDRKWEAEASAAPTTAQAARGQTTPCWEMKGCSEAQRANCPAGNCTDLPCWIQKLRYGQWQLAECKDCPKFATQVISST
jgi:hypothetical protein